MVREESYPEHCNPLILADKFSMKMENPRTVFLEQEFEPFIRTSSDPTRMIRVNNNNNNKNKNNNNTDRMSVPQSKSLSTSPETHKTDCAISPQIQKLTRMDSYRKLSLKPQSDNESSTKENERKNSTLMVPEPARRPRHFGERRAHSNLGVERVKRKKEDRRARSQSSPSFPNDIDVCNPHLGSGNSKNKLSTDSIDDGTDGARASGKTTPILIRKKSLMSLKDFNLKKLIDSKPKLSRSQSQKLNEKPSTMANVKHSATDDDADDKSVGEGPLFQATTLFVPGYDHKTKQQSQSGASRKASTPQLPRRSSKERMSIILDKVMTRQGSTPCLFKRDSKEKMKKIELIEEKEVENSDGSNEELTTSPSEEENKPADQEEATSKEQSQQNLVEQKKATIALKFKEFEDKGCKKTQDIDTPSTDHVKQLGNYYESGEAYTKPKPIPNRSTELSLKINYEPSPPQYSDFAYPEFDEKQGKRCGMESGYVSPTDQYAYEQGPFPNSWSHGQWTEADELLLRNLTIPTRAFTRDLCVTEL